ncbi:GAF domain-containing protein [Frisingicoccus sp.]|uniref:GAF domain-containing protein n=1 Tax=Frisingicoccus sp. TaxID=1918627 RepID=UPI003AB43E2A
MKDMSDFYDLLIQQAEALIGGVPYPTANYANLSALLYQSLPEINWAGFYFIQDGKLVLGPFQGKPACIEIEIGKGVCGTAVFRNETQVVKNVHEFPGHIACDGASMSEIVIPIHRIGAIIGVLDIDSPVEGRFKEDDRLGLEKLISVIEKHIL